MLRAGLSFDDEAQAIAGGKFDPLEAYLRQFVINLAEGDAVLRYPANLSAEGYDDLADYLELFFKKAKRDARADGIDLV